MNEAVRQSPARLQKQRFQTHAPAADSGETKLLVRWGNIGVKIEANFVMSGTVLPVCTVSLKQAARDIYKQTSNSRRAARECVWLGVGGGDASRCEIVAAGKIRLLVSRS